MNTQAVNKEVKAHVMDVTPEMAKRWLDQNTRNRQISRKKVDTYVKDMEEGRWTLTHQGIAFYSTGELADGQHRLVAVARTGVTVKMQVTTGLNIKSGADIDRHRPRSETDAIRIGGLSEWMKLQHVSVIKAILNLHSDSAGTYSVKQLTEVGEKIEENVRFAVGAFSHKKRYLTTAPVMAAIAMAYDHVDPVRLYEFADVLLTGMPQSEDRKDDIAAIRLREMLMSGGAGSGSVQRKEVSYKTMRAIEAFVDREHIQRLRTPTHMIYHLDAIDEME